MPIEPDWVEVEKLRAGQQRARVWALAATLAAGVLALALACGAGYVVLAVRSNPALVGTPPGGPPTPAPYISYPAYALTPPYIQSGTVPPPTPWATLTPWAYPPFQMTLVPYMFLPVPVGSGVLEVDMVSGTGPLTLAPGEYRLIRFMARLPATMDFMQSMAADLSLAGTVTDMVTTTTAALYFINPAYYTTAQVNRLFLQPGINEVAGPPYFWVLPDGSLHVVLSNFGREPLAIDNLRMAVTVHLIDGTTLTYAPPDLVTPTPTP